MEFITSKVPASSEQSEAGKITSYLKTHKQELNHVLENIYESLFGRIKKLERHGLYDAGESGGWRWRKYNDGTAECFGRFAYPHVTCERAWGGLYISEDLGAESFPFSFSEVPMVQYSISGTKSLGYLLGYPSGGDSASKERTGKFWFARGSHTTSEDTVHVDIRAYGRV